MCFVIGIALLVWKSYLLHLEQKRPLGCGREVRAAYGGEGSFADAKQHMALFFFLFMIQCFVCLFAFCHCLAKVKMRVKFH